MARGLASPLDYLQLERTFLAGPISRRKLGFRDIDLDLVLSETRRTLRFTTMPQLQAPGYLTPDGYLDLISNYPFGQHGPD